MPSLGGGDNLFVRLLPREDCYTRCHLPQRRNRSDLGAQVKIKIVVEFSVLWSVIFPLMVLIHFVKTNLSIVHQHKEIVMSKLHVMVLFGVALLSVPGRTGVNRFG